jgi:hypothetical protein
MSWILSSLTLLGLLFLLYGIWRLYQLTRKIEQMSASAWVTPHLRQDASKQLLRDLMEDEREDLEMLDPASWNVPDTTTHLWQTPPDPRDLAPEVRKRMEV